MVYSSGLIAGNYPTVGWEGVAGTSILVDSGIWYMAGDAD